MQQKNVLEYIERTVNEVPEKIAYESFEGDGCRMTFREVYNTARSIGTYLADNGFYAQPVIIFMKKTPRAIATFFGTVYGGCAYVPIDEEMPRMRIDLIIGSMKPELIICEGETLEMAKEFDYDGKIALYEDISTTPVNDDKLLAIRSRQIDTDPIYIVYTSGSTGVPKGIAACHRSVIDYIEHLSDVLGFDCDTRFGNQSPFYFDACLKELYPTIKFGAYTAIVPKQLFMFPLKLVEFLNEQKVNTVCWVVSALTMISALGALKKEVPQLKLVAFGSEVFPIKQFNRWREALPEARFINLYGPTEATGMSCYYEVNRVFEEGDVIPIGRPFDNTDILLLDEDAPVQNGEVGEICIRGTAITLGYYNDPVRTAEVFVQNPLNTHYPELIYRTGDLARYNEYGELVFVSRKDYQIKHMGHRIELGEIEANVSTIDGIYLSCAVYNKQKDRIVLYYTGTIEEGNLKDILTEKIPRYMLPAVFTRLEDMPLTPNGKVDRKRLLEQAT
ncbi:amino acid adenylation domain-containing protein [Ruminococcaceae bacterium YRB3002]|nr:amino acid adenylation domain-containing protein [Ruminococcaceae bacterium YRB3002]